MVENYQIQALSIPSSSLCCRATRSSLPSHRYFPTNFGSSPTRLQLFRDFRLSACTFASPLPPSLLSLSCGSRVWISPHFTPSARGRSLGSCSKTKCRTEPNRGEGPQKTLGHRGKPATLGLKPQKPCRVRDITHCGGPLIVDLLKIGGVLPHQSR